MQVIERTNYNEPFGIHLVDNDIPSDEKKTFWAKKQNMKKQIKTKLVSFSFDLRKIMIFIMKHVCRSLVYSKLFLTNLKKFKKSIDLKKGDVQVR